MKKILLATTVLAMTATVAAAEVTLSGDARMGIIKIGDGDAAFTSRARVSFKLSGATDSGLDFGASFRADNASNAAKGTAGSVFVSGAFGKLSMGDVDGAAAAAVGHVDGVGLTGLGDTNESVFVANGGFGVDDLVGEAFGGLTGDPSVLYSYTAGDVSVYASATNPGYVGTLGEGDAYGLGAAYVMGDYKVAIAYETLTVKNSEFSASIDHVIVGGDATFGAITVKARYGSANGGGEIEGYGLEQYALSATYAVDALAVTAFMNRGSIDEAGVKFVDVQSIGLGASYDLGGGAKVKGGFVRAEDKLSGNSDEAMDIGLTFSF
jgi:outer membrane protein OmpU